MPDKMITRMWANVFVDAAAKEADQAEMERVGEILAVEACEAEGATVLEGERAFDWLPMIDTGDGPRIDPLPGRGHEVVGWTLRVVLPVAVDLE